MALTKISGDVIKDGISVSGIVTASRFSGNVTGNVTGNINSVGVSTFSGGIQGNLTGNVSGNINSTGVSTITTLRATNIIGVSTAGITTAYIGAINDGPLAGARNRIINGDMRIDQRHNGAIATSNYVVDRFFVAVAQGSGHTSQRSVISPNYFTNSLLITIGTGASPVASTDSRIYQAVEGVNTADLAWGTASAKAVMLSFWVRSSVTGTCAGGIYNASGNRAYIFTYTVASANQWEYKTVAIPGDTAGTWSTDNTAGMYVNWDLGSGSNFQGTAGSWYAGAGWATTASVKLAQTSGATFYITGVQLEAGTVATPFERRSYGQELALCQRYYQLVNSYGFGYAPAGLNRAANPFLMCEMRVAPTLTPISATGANCSGQSAVTVSARTFGITTTVTALGSFALDSYWNASSEL